MALVYRDKSQPHDFEVLTGGLPVARISKQAPSIQHGREVGWTWHFMISAAPTGFRHRGFAENLRSAMNGVEYHWSRNAG